MRKQARVAGRLGVVGLVCAAGLLAGCGAESEAAAPAPTPTPAAVEPSESVEPSPSSSADVAEDEAVDAAKQLVEEYIEVWWAVARDKYDNHMPLVRFWGNPEVAEPELALFEALQENGSWLEGSGEVLSQTVLEYDGSGANAQVRLSACIDLTGLRGFDATGATRRERDRMRMEMLVVEREGASPVLNEVGRDPSWEC